MEGVGYLCSSWYERFITLDWQETWVPDLNPRNYGLTGFYSNWLDDTKFQLSYIVRGTLDNEWTDLYESIVGYKTIFEAERWGKIML